MTTTTDSATAVVIPARLSLLAIYNPSLGRTDEEIKDQIVFCYSRRHRARQRRRPKGPGIHRDDEVEQRETENDILRQLGLAQGMVEFAKWEPPPPLELASYSKIWMGLMEVIELSPMAKR